MKFPYHQKNPADTSMPQLSMYMHTHMPSHTSHSHAIRRKQPNRHKLTADRKPQPSYRNTKGKAVNTTTSSPQNIVTICYKTREPASTRLHYMHPCPPFGPARLYRGSRDRVRTDESRHKPLYTPPPQSQDGASKTRGGNEADHRGTLRPGRLGHSCVRGPGVRPQGALR